MLGAAVKLPLPVDSELAIPLFVDEAYGMLVPVGPNDVVELDAGYGTLADELLLCIGTELTIPLFVEEAPVGPTVVEFDAGYGMPVVANDDVGAGRDVLLPEEIVDDSEV